MADVWAKALHFLTGFLFYPLGYWVVSRILHIGRPAAGWLWGVAVILILSALVPAAYMLGYLEIVREWAQR